MLLQPKSTGFAQLLQETALTTAAVVYSQGKQPSYVVCPSSGATVACAVGGISGCSQMTRGGFCYGYICCHSLFSGGDSVGDITMDGTGGISVITCHCNTDIYTIGSNGWVGSEIMSCSFLRQRAIRQRIISRLHRSCTKQAAQVDQQEHVKADFALISTAAAA